MGRDEVRGGDGGGEGEVRDEPGGLEGLDVLANESQEGFGAGS